MKKHNAEQLTLLSLLTEKTYHDGCVRLLVKENPNLFTDKFYLSSKRIAKSYAECDLLGYIKLNITNNPKSKFIVKNLENIYKENNIKTEAELFFCINDPKNNKPLKFKIENQDLLLFLIQPRQANVIELSNTDNYTREEFKLLSLLLGAYSCLMCGKELRKKIFKNLIEEYKNKTTELDIFRTTNGTNYDSKSLLIKYFDDLPKKEIEAIIKARGKAEFFYDAVKYDFNILTSKMIKNYPPAEWIADIEKKEELNKKIKTVLASNGLYLLTKNYSQNIDKNNHLMDVLGYLGNNFKKVINFDGIINKSIKNKLIEMEETFKYSKSIKGTYEKICIQEIKMITDAMDEFLLDNNNHRLIEKFLDLIKNDENETLITDLRRELLKKTISNNTPKITIKNKAKI